MTASPISAVSAASAASAAAAAATAAATAAAAAANAAAASATANAAAASSASAGSAGSAASAADATAASARYPFTRGSPPAEADDDLWFPDSLGRRGSLSGTSAVPPPTYTSAGLPPSRASASSAGSSAASDQCIHRVDYPARYLELYPGRFDIQCCVCEKDIDRLVFETRWGVKRCSCCRRCFHNLRKCKGLGSLCSKCLPLRPASGPLRTASVQEMPICPSCNRAILIQKAKRPNKGGIICTVCNRKMHVGCFTSRIWTDMSGNRYTYFYCKDQNCIDRRREGHPSVPQRLICPSCKLEIYTPKNSYKGSFYCCFCQRKTHSSSHCYNTKTRTDVSGKKHTYIYCKDEVCVQKLKAGHPVDAQGLICRSCGGAVITKRRQGLVRCQSCNQPIHQVDGCRSHHVSVSAHPIEFKTSKNINKILNNIKKISSTRFKTIS